MTLVPNTGQNVGALLEEVGSAFEPGRSPDQLRLVREAADRGSSDAMYHLALLYLVGDLLPRSLGEARVWLTRSAERGHVEAGELHVALLANGSGAPANWPAARALLERQSAHSPAAEEQVTLLGFMNLSEHGLPCDAVRSVSLCSGLKLTRFPNFLSQRECEHLARSAAEILEPAVVVDPDTGQRIAHPVRTSDGAVIGPGREDLVIRAINLRIAAATGTKVEQGEPLSILRYRPRQQYRLHSDALPGTSNQRIRTMLIYLNDAFTGGETHFPAVGVVVTPKAGDAVAFDSILPDGSVDPASRHAGLPVIKGSKWLATRWIREHPYNPWSQRSGKEPPSVDA